jgi:hypothetical protein
VTPDLFGPAVRKDAFVSPCGLYRYWLCRVWDDRPPVCWVMLNPSTADASLDDPTIRRCVAFARSWGAGGIYVVNLFALRATDPGQLSASLAPVGPDNDHAVCSHATTEGQLAVVAAWGTGGGYLARDRAVCRMLRERGVDLKCLGTTRHGHPRHPLYVSGNTPLQPFPTQAKKGA